MATAKMKLLLGYSMEIVIWGELASCRGGYKNLMGEFFLVGDEQIFGT